MSDAELSRRQPKTCYPLVREDIERFLERYRANQYPPEMVSQYQRNIQLFYRFLPEDKCIHPGSMEQWTNQLLADGYSPRTVNTKLSSAQQFLAYLGQWECRITERVPFDRAPVPHPELTRNGRPLDRVTVFRQLQRLCREAQIPEEKGNPRCLRKLYQTMRSEVEANITF